MPRRWRWSSRCPPVLIWASPPFSALFTPHRYLQFRSAVSGPFLILGEVLPQSSLKRAKLMGSGQTLSSRTSPCRRFFPEARLSHVFPVATVRALVLHALCRLFLRKKAVCKRNSYFTNTLSEEFYFSANLRSPALDPPLLKKAGGKKKRCLSGF